jgi:phasin
MSFAGIFALGAEQHRSGTMSDQVQDRFEIPKEMRSMAEASVEQARRTCEKLLASAQATAGSIEERGNSVRAGVKDIGSKAFGFAETNMQASLDYADSLAHAKNLPEMMRLQGDYVKTQMRVLTEQASEMGQVMGQAMGRAAIEAAKSK